MTEHDVLVGFRLRLFTRADELANVSAACRAMGVDRSTYYRLKHRVDRWGREALNVRERRRPRMLNQIGPHLEQRIVAFALGHPGYGPRRISAELALSKLVVACLTVAEGLEEQIRALGRPAPAPWLGGVPSPCVGRNPAPCTRLGARKRQGRSARRQVVLRRQYAAGESWPAPPLSRS